MTTSPASGRLASFSLVDFQIEEQLTAPVTAGTEIGSIKYLVNEDIYKIETVVTTEDVPAIDFSWCLSQILSRYSL